MVEKRSFGAIKDTIDIRDYKFKNVAGSIELPEEFELKIPPVKNQNQVSSCTAHATAEIAEHFNIVQFGEYKDFSTGYIYGNRYGYTGKGLALRDALKTLKNKGICSYNSFPYNLEVPIIIDRLKSRESSIKDAYENRISTYFKIDKKSTKDIKTSLIKNGPCLVSYRWYDDMKYKNGKMESTLSGEYGLHAMMIYGWNKDGWKVLNSWGRLWGNNGTAIFPFDMPIEEIWGVTDTITDSIITPPKNKLYQFISKIINKILNYLINLFNKQ